MPTTEADWRTSVLPFTLAREGGLSVDPHDPGNWTGGKVGKGELKGTKYGIAAASHPDLDIRHLTLDAATDIYWREYVVAPGFARLGLPLLMVAFDAGVNCGPGRAAKWVKAAEVERDVKAQIAKLTALNLAYHKGLKTWPRYGKGWGDRIEACEKRALLLAAAHPVPLAVSTPAPASHAPVVPRSGNTVHAVPKPAHQPPASAWALFLRVLADALFRPIPKAHHA